MPLARKELDKMKPKLFVIILASLALTGLSPSLRAQHVKSKVHSNVPVVNDQTRPDHFRGLFTIQGPVRTNTSFITRFTITPQQNFSTLKIIVVFPDELQIKGGQSQRFEINQLDSTSSHTIFFEATAISTGEFEILAYVEGLQGGRYKLSNIYSTIIRIDESSGTLLKKKSLRFDQLSPQEKEELIRQKPKQDTTRINYLEKDQHNNFLQSAFKVTGRWLYDDIDDGLTRKPIRYATVKVIESGLFGGTLGTGYTDSQGYYSITVNFTESKSLFVRVICESEAAKVTSGFLGGTYKGDTDAKSVNASDASTWNFGWLYFNATYANWPALDDAIDEYQWIDSQTAWKRSQVEFRWPVGNWPSYKYDSILGERIELPARSTWPWDRPVILHEYAHAVMYKAYGNSVPSGSGPSPHDVTSESSGGFALTEGWAEFVQCAVDNTPSNLGSANTSGNIETNGWYNYFDSGDFDGDVVEGSVASILWDIFDSRSGDDDGLSLGFNNSGGSIWYIILNNRPNDINQFWTYWFQRYGYGQQLRSIFYTYGINKDSSPSASLTVIYPNGSETLLKGTNYTITWNHSNVSGNIQIDLYKGGTNVLQLAAGASNTGSHPFNPPLSLTNGSDYKIGISAMSGTVSDFSDINFTISSPITYTLTITSTNGTVTKNPNQTNYASGSTVQLTATPSTGYTFTGWSVSSGGSFSSTSSATTTFTITGNASITANFSLISTGSISVFPAENFNSSGNQGGTFSPMSKIYTLTNPGNSSINWAATKSASWLTLSQTSGTLSSGGSAQVTVSINSNANNLSFGLYSDNVSFTNTSNGNGNTTRTVTLTVNDIVKIIVTSPTGGALWNIGSNATINWTSTGSIGNVNIKLSTDGGNTFPITLSNNTPNDGTETITVPNYQSNICRIRVESASIQNIYGDSPNFAIQTQPVTSGQWQVIGTISLSGTQNPLSISINNSKAYVSRNSNRLTVLDLNNNSEIANISFGSYTSSTLGKTGILGNRAYVALSNLGSNGQVAVINTDNNSVTSYIPVGADPWGVATYNNKVYVTNNVWWSNGDPSTVKVIDTNSNSVIATINVGINPNSIAIDPSTGKAFVTNGNYLSKSVSVINTNNNSVIATVPMPNEPRGVVISGNRAYVANQVNWPNGTAEVIDISTNNIVASIPIGRDATDIAAISGYVFVANQSSKTVSIIDTNTNNVIKTLTVGNDPTGIAVDPNTNKVYVTNQTDRTISIIAQVQQTYTVTISSNPSNGGTTSGGGTHNSGNSVTVTATANSGYIFTNWTENGNIVSTNSNYTFAITTNRTLVANFIPSTSASIKPIIASTTIPKGTEFWVEVKVGDPNTVNDLYGISFRLSSNNSNCTYVDQSATQSDFLGSSVIPFSQKFDNQTVDIAITRTSTPGVSGSEIVAKAKFTSSSNITSDQTVVFSLSSIVVNNSLGNTIPMTSATATVTIKAVVIVNIWPGDCNNDLTVSAADILPIGQYYGQTISTPNNQGSQWQAYPRQPWASDGTIPKRIYADANGDGTINATDVLPIGLNYGKTHSTSNSVSLLLAKINNIESIEKTLGNSTLKLVGPTKVKNNTNFTIQVVVGDPVSVTDLYGISFKIKSNNSTCSFIDNTAQQGPFLGGNVLKFFQTIDNQTVDAALTKTSAPGVSGSGTIATFDYKSSVDQTVTFSLSGVSATDSKGSTIPLDVLPTGVLVDVKKSVDIPNELSVSQNYPNPFNPSTTIKFSIPNSQFVTLKVYDMLGREATTLVNEEKQPGIYEVKFNGSKLSSGVYFYRLQSGSYSDTKKFILLK